MDEGDERFLLWILAGLVSIAAVLVVRGLTRRLDRGRVTCACGRDVSSLAFRLPHECACGATVGGPPTDASTARLRVARCAGPFAGRRPLLLILGVGALGCAIALVVAGRSVLARDSRAIDLMPTSLLSHVMSIAPEAVVDSAERRLTAGDITPPVAARLLEALGRNREARKAAFDGMFYAVGDRWVGPLGHSLLSLAADAGDAGDEAFVALAAPTIRLGKDDETGDGLLWITFAPEVEGLWFARIDDVLIDGVSTRWKIEGERRVDGRAATPSRVLREGVIRIPVPFDELQHKSVDVHFVAAGSPATIAAMEDRVINESPPEEWGVDGFARHEVRRAEAGAVGGGFR